MMCRHGIKLERVGDRFFHKDQEHEECAISRDATFDRAEKLIEGLRAARKLSTGVENKFLN
jgi:hypothetical protein